MVTLLTFLSGFLLFQVEPLISKYVLPWYGGVPAVWTTCLLFFHLCLLAGYGWGYLLNNFVAERYRTYLQAVLFISAIAFLPISPDEAWRPNSGESPVIHLLLLLTTSVGLPFFALSTTTPVLQSWYHSRSNRSPYWLYAVSNAGSLCGLLSYPLLVERVWDGREQALFWSFAFALFAFALITTAVASGRALASAQASGAVRRESHPIMFWILLSACLSIMLMATTNYVCRTVAVLPLLWVVPLILFLLSYVFTYGFYAWYSRKVFLFLFAVGILALLTVSESPQSSTQVIITNFGTFFFGCILCNGELYRVRPEPALLGKFYFFTALGGVLGSLFVGVVAPAIFIDYTEYQIGFQLSCVVVLAILLQSDKRFERNFLLRLLRLAIPVFLLVTSCWIDFISAQDSNALFQSRNFFGLAHVREYDGEGGGKVRSLYHDATIHGSQLLSHGNELTPTTYYGSESGAGLALRFYRPDSKRRIGCVGLGAGTLAVYGRPNDEFTFYEINPLIGKIAQSHFSFLANSNASWNIIYGDARLSLEREPIDKLFDVLIIDAFNGDAIPTHLLSHEALQLYLTHLKADGLLVFHTSNTHLDLGPVIARLALESGLKQVKVENVPSAKSVTLPNEYILLSRTDAFFRIPEIAERSVILPTDYSAKLWTDHYANLWDILR